MKNYKGPSLKKSEPYTDEVPSGHSAQFPHSRDCSYRCGSLKIEAVNDICSKRRKLDDSCLDDAYETPAKRFYSQKTVSPDVVCVVDSCSPLPKVKHTFVFDTDVEETLSVSPTTNVTYGFECLSNTLNKSVPNSKSGQCMGKNDEKGGEVKCKHKDKGVTAEEEGDGGYFSRAYWQILSTSKNLPLSESPWSPLTTSSPLVRRGKRELLEGDNAALSLSEIFDNNKAAVCQPISLSVDYSSLEEAPVILVGRTLGALEGDVCEVCSFGDPIFESSKCQGSTLECRLDSEKEEFEGKGIEGGVLHSNKESKATLEYEGTFVTLDICSETTLPFEGQVDSVVVEPNHQASSSNPIVPQQPHSQPSNQPENRNPQDGITKKQRPVIFDREEDWQREKQLYMHSVTRHMNQYPGTGQDAMTELMILMTRVADQRSGTHGTHWQHPSDLTSRNYQKRFGNTTPMFSLDEWQNYNNGNDQRFAKVPKKFERNPLP